MQVRALGDLTVDIVRLAGAPASGVQVDLISLETGIRTSQWMAEGQIDASSSELLTDAEGRLELRGLPHGLYTVMVDGIVVLESHRLEAGASELRIEQP